MKGQDEMFCPVKWNKVLSWFLGNGSNNFHSTTILKCHLSKRPFPKWNFPDNVRLLSHSFKVNSVRKNWPLITAVREQILYKENHVFLFLAMLSAVSTDGLLIGPPRCSRVTFLSGWTTMKCCMSRVWIYAEASVRKVSSVMKPTRKYVDHTNQMSM